MCGTPRALRASSPHIHRIPVVVTDTGGASELVRGNGMIVPCGEVEALQAALSRLLDNQEKWGAMGAQSREIAESMSWSAVADRYRAVLLKAAGKE